MKYVIVILGGAADQPQPQLDGLTPLQHADAPALEQLAGVGRLGEARFIPPDAKPPVPPGPDAALLPLLGYAPEQHYPGRAPLHALGAGVPIAEGDWCFELSLLSVIDGVVQPTGAVNIPDGEAEALVRGLLGQLDLPGAVVHPGQPTRPGTPAHLLVDPAAAGRDWAEVVTQRPDDIAHAPLHKAMPVGGPAGERLRQVIDTARRYFADHELNRARAEMGEPAITHLWPWGQGTLPAAASGQRATQPWRGRFGRSAVVVSEDPAMRGVARLTGIDTLRPSPSREATATDDEADRRASMQLAAAAVDAINQYDLVIVHTPAPQDASMDGGPDHKTRAIRQADALLVKPLLRAVSSRDEPYRIMVTPLHTTLLQSRRESPAPVPFLVAGHKFAHVVPRPLTESAAAATDLRVPFGHELMEYFLLSGLK